MTYIILLFAALLGTHHCRATPLSPLGLLGNLVTGGSLIENLINRILSRDPFAELNGNLQIIKEQLEDIERSIDSVRQDLKDLGRQIESLHDMTRNVAVFGSSLKRLEFFRSQALRLEKDELGLLLRTSSNIEWADMIDTLDDDGVYQIIEDLNCMVMGCSRLIGKSLLFKYIDSLEVSTGDVFWEYVTDMSLYLINLQVEAFTYMFQALDIKQKAKAKYYDQFKTSLNNQKKDVFGVVFDQRLRYWPKGTFTIPLVGSTGCPGLGNPSLSFSTGWRYHDTEDDDNINDISSPYHFAADPWRNNIKLHFCTKDADADEDIRRWPTGRYCLFKHGNCPEGMDISTVWMSDEHNNNNNHASGIVPDGEVKHWYEKDSVLVDMPRWSKKKIINFGIESTYKFCCKVDGNEELVFPVSKPFILIPYVNTGCPIVAHMKSQEEWLKFDGDDGWKNPITRQTSYQVDYCEQGSGYGPKISRSSGAEHKCQDVTMYFCYYERDDF